MSEWSGSVRWGKLVGRGESGQHIVGDAGHVIVVVVVRQAGTPADRAH